MASTDYPFYKSEDDTNIVYNPNVNKKEGFGAIKSCSLPKLIEKLTSTKQLHTYFSSAFFLTYRDFTTPLKIIHLLVNRYTGPPPDASKDSLRLFEIEIDIIQANVLNIFKTLIGTLVQSDFDTPGVSSSITEFFNSLEENTKNELFLKFFQAKKLARPPGSIPKPVNNIISSAASTMRFSFSVSPRTQSPSSTNVLSGLLSNGNNSSSSNGNGNNNNNNNNNNSNNSNNNVNSAINSPTFDASRSSMKMGKGIMKLLQSNIANFNNGQQQNSNTSPSGSPSSTLTSSSTNSLFNQAQAFSNEENGNSNNSDHSIPPSTPPISPVSPIGEKTAFLPEAIARELTIMEWELITALTVVDITGKAWNQSINIQNLTTWFNRISSWVSTKIISKETPEERATIIEAFINIANYAKELKNYNCVMEILGSLHNSSISRLKCSWALLSQKTNEIFQNLNTIMSTDGNFKNYRKQLTMVLPSEPCIPYLGLFLTDYTYLDESNPSSLSNEMINIDRITLISQRVQEFFQLFTNCAYTHQSNSSVRDAILGEKVWDENEIFRLSKIREESSNSPFQTLKETNGIGSNGGRESNGSLNGNGSGKDKSEKIDKSDYKLEKLDKDSKDLLLSSASQTVRRKNFVTKYRMSFTGNDPLPSIASSLSEREWKILTTNAKTCSYSRGKTILSIGETNTNLYRVISGRVKIDSLKSFSENDLGGSGYDEVTNSLMAIKARNRLSLNLPAQEDGYYYVEEGEIFGQESFLYTDRPMLTSIIVDSDQCELMEIEKTFVLQLFTSEHVLAATFYKHIAIVMAERLRMTYINFTTNANTSSGGGGSSNGASSTTNNSLSSSVSIGNFNSPNINKIDFKRRSTIFETPTSLDLLRDGNDTSFRTKFGLSQDEVIIKRYQCKHGKKNGTLYITKHNLCFEGKFLGMNKNKTIPFDQTDKILPIDKNVLSVAIKDKVKKFVFKSPDDLNEINGIVGKIWANHFSNNSNGGNKSSSSTTTTTTTTSSSTTLSPLTSSVCASSSTPPQSPKIGRNESFSNIKDLPTKDEWNQILKGTKPLTFKKGEILICEGIEYQKMFQIVKGECIVVKSLIPTPNTIDQNILYHTNSNNVGKNSSSSSNLGTESGLSPEQLVDPKNSVIVSKLSSGSLFGEMSFLLPGGSVTSLVVSSDEVEVYVLEHYYLHIMLKSKSYLSPKFYKYIACILDSRNNAFRC